MRATNILQRSKQLHFTWTRMQNDLVMLDNVKGLQEIVNAQYTCCYLQ